MRELSGRVAVLCAVLCILQAAVLAGAAADVTVSTHVTIVTDTDVVPPSTGGGGNGGSSGGDGGGSGGSSGSGQTAPPVGDADGNVTADEDVSIRETGSGDASFPAVPLKGPGLQDGNLTCLACEGEAVVGNVLRIAGVFQNPGPADTNATLVGNVFRSGAFVGVIDGETRAVMAGTEENLSMNFTPREPGDYLVRAHVVYGGKMTGVSDVSFPVTDGGTVPFIFPFVGAALLVAVSAAVRWQRRNS
ncbi:MAG: hypothetical protein PHP59_05985 [Methanofollis sp.]|uniref:hypothetical protein n=1 Tax=Methanofollis sp. TaxID=2052835 RepID=UPI00261900F0|nr:hypothetical protein [Methanofollis sp.]MDD4254911.1 hypothetical protein [Methanofollis sp.]